jgi:hypothetical protein
MSSAPPRIVELVETFDCNLDNLAYELYNLTDEEIKIVEESNQK